MLENCRNDNLIDFIQTLTTDEKSILKSKLCKKIPSFFDDTNNLRYTEECTQEKFKYLASIFRMISPNYKTFPENGIVYRGKPFWVNDSLLQQLQIEALIRRAKPLDRVDHFLGCGGACADLLATSKEVISFVSHYAGLVKPTGIASYLYYDKPGLGIRPHVDTDVFSVNLILMLKHQFESETEPSATLVFPESGETEKYRLSVGEVMIMYGGAVVHSRSIIGINENVQLVTIGFKHAVSDEVI